MKSGGSCRSIEGSLAPDRCPLAINRPQLTTDNRNRMVTYARTVTAEHATYALTLDGLHLVVVRPIALLLFFELGQHPEVLHIHHIIVCGGMDDTHLRWVVRMPRGAPSPGPRALGPDHHERAPANDFRHGSRQPSARQGAAYRAWGGGGGVRRGRGEGGGGVGGGGAKGGGAWRGFGTRPW